MGFGKEWVFDWMGLFRKWFGLFLYNLYFGLFGLGTTNTFLTIMAIIPLVTGVICGIVHFVMPALEVPAGNLCGEKVAAAKAAKTGAASGDDA